ncbi:MAG: EAL domain-containing protein [Magnetococcales bacterium]|nr:EAL domain-containing protein [Magnetococcales bacterium]
MDALAQKPLFFVVDDDAVTRLMLSRFLEKLGYATRNLEEGAQALAAFEEERPDMVLMDAKMPVMDGFEACTRMKEHPRGKQIPVIMITGLHDDESVDRAYKAGAADFITKPIHWAILRNRVKYLLKVIQGEREHHLAASVFASTTEGIVVTDKGAIIQSVNPAFCKITGYTQEEAVGQGMNILKSGRHDDGFYEALWDSLRESNKWQGEIWNRRKNGEVYPQWANISAIRGPDGETRNFVTVFSDLTSIRESQENLLYITGHDTLTDLPNRLLFHERLSHTLVEAKWQDTRVAVLLLDLDRFKVINDTMGHDTGDTLLVQVGQRLKENLPGNATLARMGGDEFGVILPKVVSSMKVAHVAQAVLDVLTKGFEVDGMELFVGASIGIGLFPQDGDDVKTLVKNTDAAMYHAKEQGRNNFQFYTSELNTSSLARMLLESELRNALEKEDFLLFYQPQMDLNTRVLSGVEALIRWNSPKNGMISPGQFIPLAEETGLIIPMGQWALRTACRHAVKWQAEGLPPIRVSVNLSGIQFRQPDFTKLVTDTLEETGLEPGLLELELTESIAMGDVEETLAKLNTLSKAGVRLAIDDFGTGFSSLSYLKRFPIDTLKVDQSFVRNCTTDSDDAAIIHAFIGLAHSLGLTVIAEGVETMDQLQLLKDQLCNEIQGYYYERPLPEEEFLSRMKQKQQADAQADSQSASEPFRF